MCGMLEQFWVEFTGKLAFGQLKGARYVVAYWRSFGGSGSIARTNTGVRRPLPAPTVLAAVTPSGQ